MQWLSLFSLFFLVCGMNAFVVDRMPHPKISLTLHPEQAAELEACAYDLMKEAAIKATTTTSTTAARRGPFAWCRRAWSGRSTVIDSTATRVHSAGSSKTAAYANKKP